MSKKTETTQEKLFGARFGERAYGSVGLSQFGITSKDIRMVLFKMVDGERVKAFSSDVGVQGGGVRFNRVGHEKKLYGGQIRQKIKDTGLRNLQIGAFPTQGIKVVKLRGVDFVNGDTCILRIKDNETGAVLDIIFTYITAPDFLSNYILAEEGSGVDLQHYF